MFFRRFQAGFSTQTLNMYCVLAGAHRLNPDSNALVYLHPDVLGYLLLVSTSTTLPWLSQRGLS